MYASFDKDWMVIISIMQSSMVCRCVTFYRTFTICSKNSAGSDGLLSIRHSKLLLFEIQVSFTLEIIASQIFSLQEAKKGVLFIDFPPVLQLQLKRFEYDFSRDMMVKVVSTLLC